MFNRFNNWKEPVKQEKQMRKYYAWEIRNVYTDVRLAFDRMDPDIVMDSRMLRFKEQAKWLEEIWITIGFILDGDGGLR